MNSFATSYGTVTVDPEGYPISLARGPRCGSCKAHHKSVADIRFCYDLRAEQTAQQAGEIAAELAVERHFEDRGYWESQAQDAHEAAHGVVDFQTAWDIACPERVAEREQAQVDAILAGYTTPELHIQRLAESDTSRKARLTREIDARLLRQHR